MLFDNFVHIFPASISSSPPLSVRGRGLCERWSITITRLALHQFQSQRESYFNLSNVLIWPCELILLWRALKAIFNPHFWNMHNLLHSMVNCAEEKSAIPKRTFLVFNCRELWVMQRLDQTKPHQSTQSLHQGYPGGQGGCQGCPKWRASIASHGVKRGVRGVPRGQRVV